jgi:hypothetical protein
MSSGNRGHFCTSFKPVSSPAASQLRDNAHWPHCVSVHAGGSRHSPHPARVFRSVPAPHLHPTESRPRGGYLQEGAQRLLRLAHCAQVGLDRTGRTRVLSPLSAFWRYATPCSAMSPGRLRRPGWYQFRYRLCRPELPFPSGCVQNLCTYAASQCGLLMTGDPTSGQTTNLVNSRSSQALLQAPTDPLVISG